MAIPEEVAKVIGKSLGEPQVFEIERGAIRRFADAVDDPNPLHRDVEYARNSKYGEIIAPVGFFGWPIKGPGFLEALMEAIDPMVKAGYPALLDAGLEYEPFVPIRAGDILTSSIKIANISEKTTSSGKGMLLPAIEFNFLNQNGDKVLTMRMSLILRQL
jgi:acyl dehydratase